MQITSVIVGHMFLVLGFLASAAVVPIGLPGQFGALTLLVLALVAAGKWSWWIFVLAFLIAIGAESLEAMFGLRGTRKAGGSWLDSLAAFGGGIVGAILGSLTPLFLVATVVGALLGTYLGAFISHFLRVKKGSASRQVARGALIGRLIGTAFKLGATTGIAILTYVGMAS